MICSPFHVQQQEQDPTNLYIANLPLYMTETNLEDMFHPFGQVISTRILRDNQGHSRGVGFARMESKEKCEQIIQTFNGQKLPGGNARRNKIPNLPYVHVSITPSLSPEFPCC